MEARTAAPPQSHARPATAFPGPAPLATRIDEAMGPDGIAGSPPGPAEAATADADAGAGASAAEALAAARCLLHQLRASHADAAAAAEAHRREREGLMHQLQAIQVGGGEGGRSLVPACLGLCCAAAAGRTAGLLTG